MVSGRRLRGQAALNILEPLHNLTNKLFKGYEKNIAPMAYVNTKDQTNTSITAVHLNNMKIIHMDETNELLTMTIDFYQVWFDPRLRWNYSNHFNIEDIYVREDHVWTPPFRVYSNEIKDHREESLRTVRVQYVGYLHSRSTPQITTICKLNMETFPFDIQTCNITFGLSLIHTDLYRFDVMPSLWVETNCCLFGNSAWDVISIKKTDFYSNQLLHVTKTKDRIVVVMLKLKRNPVYYMYMIVLPATVINTFSILGVFMKGNGKFEKLEMGLAHIMTMMVLLTMIAEKLPKTSQVPLLGKYIIFNLCSMIVALMISTSQKSIRHFFTRKYLRIGKKQTKIILTSCIFCMQIANFGSSIYIFYRYWDFESSYGQVCEPIQTDFVYNEDGTIS